MSSLNLTQSSTPVPAPEAPSSDPATPAMSEPRATAATPPVVRVMAYLTGEEAEKLDEAWLRLRRLPARPSKSDILRAALMWALDNPDDLDKVLSRQYDSTLSRQRSSKAKGA